MGEQGLSSRGIRRILCLSIRLAISNADDMLHLGVGVGGWFSSLSVVQMEHDILWKLRWNMFPPTTYSFACYMICMFPSEIPKSPTRYIIQELSKYMTELAVCK